MMPTHERRYYLSLLKGIKEDAEENKTNQGSVSYNGKGSRTRTVGGTQLVSMMQNGQIPNV